MEDYKEKYENLLHDIDIAIAGQKEGETKIVLQNIKERNTESEDERIRKEIIDYIKEREILERPTETRIKKEWISWLEKQGEHANFRNKIQIGDEVTRNEDGVLVNLSQFKRMVKQGEQKSTDEIKSKFKVGDFIINEYGFIMQIDGIDGNIYVYHVLDNNHILKHDITKTEKSCHLWTIHDAKKGDILQANNCTLIFDSLKKDLNGNTVISSWYFCDTNTFYGMSTSQPDLWVTECVVPATKEQRDLLFQKMKEAGYEWDAAKKELRPQNRWKPSENQIDALDRLIRYDQRSLSDNIILNELKEQLKKLMKE